MSELKVHASACNIEPMVQIEEVRESFAARLREALEANEIPSWGAGARLAKMAGVTPKASSKWLNGEAMPGGAKMLAIAEALKVRVEWLEYGRGPRTDRSGFEVAETDGSYKLARSFGPAGVMLGAAVGAVAGAIQSMAGGGDDAAKPLEKLTEQLPLTLQVRRIKEILSSIDESGLDEAWATIVGISYLPRETLELLDAVLEAMAMGGDGSPGDRSHHHPGEEA